MNDFDNMTDLEKIDALDLECKKHYYEFRHQEMRNEIQKDQIKALENTIKELTHKLIEQEIELSRLIKKVI